ncbi:MAG: hypothetical protein MZV49_01675 [Rhodopseudomonas palustris]|nr:hypothetical protein [Rhodopseudomonas palustris]
MCGTTQTPIGPNNECCENGQIYAGGNGQLLCCAGTVVNGTCDLKKPKLPICLDCCAPGYVKSGGKCCLQSQLSSKGQCCPLGQTPSADGSCQPWKWLPKLSLCCASGFVPTAKGSAAPPPISPPAVNAVRSRSIPMIARNARPNLRRQRRAHAASAATPAALVSPRRDRSPRR